jgi:hypothetical protein
MNAAATIFYRVDILVAMNHRREEEGVWNSLLDFEEQNRPILDVVIFQRPRGI